MSKYLVNKFLFMIDRDHDLTERYRANPVATVAWWEAEQGSRLLNCTAAEKTTWLAFENAERTALCSHDHVALFSLGAHPFLTLTLWIAMFERDFTEPLAMQLDYAAKLAQVGQPYPDIST